MDAQTAETIQALVRMIDSVNERNALGRLSLDGVMVLLASNRRQGLLSDVEIKTIDQTFAEMESDEALERYEKVRALFDAARKLWKAAEPQ